MQQITFQEAIKALATQKITSHEVYFIDLVLLCEMAWADGTIQVAEREIIFSYLDHHVNSINRLAGCNAVTHKEARQFLARFLDERPDISQLDAIREVFSAVRLDNKDPEVVENTRTDILNACLDIAASSVTKYPYGLKERFTEEEKEYYHKLTDLLQRPVLEGSAL
ncbi:MAG: TerB family tellurite resistance protein [Desulfobulbaceae bacterium]|nr:MAG: TerB family tellurite resistance protein [Desulfobulbaceae bacterium]